MRASQPARTAESGTRVHFAGATQAGRVRAINQDSVFVDQLASGVLAVVADGMGGHNTGEVASQKAVTIISRELAASRAHPPLAIAKAVQAANLDIYDYARAHPEHQGMGTTLTTVLIDDQVGLVGHIGDSRAYLIRDGTIRQLTQDHSWVADRVRQGILTEDEAKRHRWRNVITNALGALPEIKLDIAHFEVRSGDRLLLCSDGISMLLSDAQLLEVVSHHPPEDAVARLMQLANDRGSPDNLSAIVLYVEQVEVRPKPYALPSKHDTPASVALRGTLSGIRQIEEAYPAQDWLSKLRRQAWYPYRYWLAACVALVILFVYFSSLRP
jgi:protein phosphatase